MKSCTSCIFWKYAETPSSQDMCLRNVCMQRGRFMEDPEVFSCCYYEEKKYKNDKDKLWDLCRKFMVDTEILCVETIYQTDYVAEKATEFIDDVASIVGFPDYDEETCKVEYKE